MREWLTIIIALLIVAVVLDGIRRMRHARRYKLRMSPRMPRESGGPAERESYGSELPNGGARVVNVRKADDAEQLYRQMQQSREEKKRRLGRPTRIPQQVTLNLDDQVPTLMEVEAREHHDQPQEHQLPEKRLQTGRQQTHGQQMHRTEKPDAAARRMPEIDQPAQQRTRRDDLLDDIAAFGDDRRIEPRLSNVDDLEEDPPPQEWNGGSHSATAHFDEPVATADSQENDDVVSSDVEDAGMRADAVDCDAPDWDGDHDYPDQSENGDEIECREPEDVLVINVMAPKGELFAGGALLDTVLERGMRYGDMNIFHRHEHPNGQGAVLYSMANIVVPGTFDLATMRSFSTPGVSLFLTLPLEADSGAAFENMLVTAKAIAYNLGGEMKDEQRSVMTAQTIEHYRTRIMEFERKQLSRAPV